MKIRPAILVSVFLLSSSLFASNPETESFDWRGFSLRLDWGMAQSLTRAPQSLQPFNMNLEPFFEYGVEYAFVFESNLYLSAGLSWFITYPRNFTTPTRGFLNPPISLWWVPLTYAQVGYVFPNDMLLSVGVVYLWAVDAQIKFPIAPNWFFETKAIVWLDRFLDPSSYPFYGYDTFHLSLGVGYKF